MISQAHCREKSQSSSHPLAPLVPSPRLSSLARSHVVASPVPALPQRRGLKSAASSILIECLSPAFPFRDRLSVICFPTVHVEMRDSRRRGTEEGWSVRAAVEMGGCPLQPVPFHLTTFQGAQPQRPQSPGKKDGGFHPGQARRPDPHFLTSHTYPAPPQNSWHQNSWILTLQQSGSYIGFPAPTELLF